MLCFNAVHGRRIYFQVLCSPISCGWPQNTNGTYFDVFLQHKKVSCAILLCTSLLFFFLGLIDTFQQRSTRLQKPLKNQKASVTFLTPAWEVNTTFKALTFNPFISFKHALLHPCSCSPCWVSSSEHPRSSNSTTRLMGKFPFWEVMSKLSIAIRGQGLDMKKLQGRFLSYSYACPSLFPLGHGEKDSGLKRHEHHFTGYVASMT